MKLDPIRSVLALACCTLAFGCMRAAPNSSEIEETPEGKPCGPDAVIEDSEDNNNQTNVQGGRGGYMYTFVDKVGSTIDPPSGESGGVFAPTQGGAQGSQYAMRMKGTVGAAAIVYAGMGLNFVDPKGFYDASKYKGVSFWAKKGPGSSGKVRLKVPDVSTDPDGKLCTECYNDFGMDMNLTEEWTKYTVPFSRMKQLAGWGAPHKNAVDPSKVYGIQFQVNDKGQPFEIWVDNIAFTGCGG
jgi:endoglucanase